MSAGLRPIFAGADIFLVGPQFTLSLCGPLGLQRQPLRSFAVLIFIQLRQTVCHCVCKADIRHRYKGGRGSAHRSSQLRLGEGEPQPQALAGLGKIGRSDGEYYPLRQKPTARAGRPLPGRQLPPVPRPPPDGCPEGQAPEGRESYGCPFVPPNSASMAS